MKKSYIPINKKGSFGADNLVMIVMGLFVFAIMMFIGHKIWVDVSDDLAGGFFLGANESQEIVQSGNNLMNGFDLLFVMLLVLIFVGLIASVYFIDSHPIFLGISLIIFFIMIFLGAIISDIFVDISNAAEFANETASFPMTTFVMSNLMFFLVIMGGVSAIMLYAKAKGFI